MQRRITILIKQVDQSLVPYQYFNNRNVPLTASQMKWRFAFTVRAIYFSEEFDQECDQVSVPSLNRLVQWSLIRIESMVNISYQTMLLHLFIQELDHQLYVLFLDGFDQHRIDLILLFPPLGPSKIRLALVICSYKLVWIFHELIPLHGRF